MGDETDPVGADQAVGARVIRSHRRGEIHPAGMSYARALQIAVEVLEKSVARVDWFAANGVYQTPRIVDGRVLDPRVARASEQSRPHQRPSGFYS